MKKIIITQSNYIPWKGYFDSINFVNEFVIYDEVQYTKRDWRNRNKIKTPNGPLWLSVPIEVKGKFFQRIKETHVLTTENWRLTHWKTIQMNYSKTPFFKTYKDTFEEFYMHNNDLSLSNINYSLIKIINKILGITTTLHWSDEIPHASEERNERLIEICKHLDATDYYSGPAAKVYMNEELFKREGINVHFFNFGGYPEYKQLYGEFIHELSILDLIFNEGPNSINFMKSFSGNGNSLIL